MNTVLTAAMRSSSARRAVRLMVGCLLAFAIATGLAGATAFAYVPGGDLVGGISFKNFQLKSTNFALWNARFSTLVAGPDGLSGPDGTPDGRGAFQFYVGAGGLPGAIYAARDQNGGVVARAVYGAILTSWAASGHETGHGYPATDEFTAGQREINWGCQAGDRAQYFGKTTNPGNSINPPFGGGDIACFHPANGVTTWHPWFLIL